MLSFDWFELLGIVLSLVASIAVGSLWYSPFLFGNVWMREVGLTEEKMKQSSVTPAQAIGFAVALGLVFAVFVNLLFTWIGVRTVAQGALLGVACCVTFFCVPLLVHSVFEDRSKKAWLIYVAHELVLAAVIGAIVSWSILA